jgi:hypothetical protein
MTFDPRPYLDSIAEEVEWGPEIDCPATTAQRIRLAGKEIDRLRADLIAEQGYRAAAEEIAQRRGEMVDALTAERDEARREICLASCRLWIPEHHLTVAAERGWDCWKEVKP